ncbi:hypothetical protein V502_04174 [Pseudogymnoascus sp. VKM F-4520 (FW-2644)]|nr:hypothetical protein V502_04174 [Pseudogymnoascus sp. VKM F-4520 (FW-2644)]
MPVERHPRAVQGHHLRRTAEMERHDYIKKGSKGEARLVEERADQVDSEPQLLIQGDGNANPWTDQVDSDPNCWVEAGEMSRPTSN